MDDFLLFFADLEVLCLSTRGRALLEGGLNFKKDPLNARITG
jgi:hypothetical protein